jgi:UDP-glucoronosyl and UDP-glucosyl transferase
MSSESRKHVLFVAIPAFGHMIPLLQLAQKISPHHRVTFAVSQIKMKEIQERELLTDNSISLVSIPDGYYEGEDENTLSGSIFNRMLKYVTQGVQTFLETIPTTRDQLLRNNTGITSTVNLVIADSSLAQPLAILCQRNVPFYFFNSAASAMTLFSLNFDPETPAVPDQDLEEIPFDEMPQLEATPLPIIQVMKTLLTSLQNVTPLAAGIIANSVYDMEADVIDLIKAHERMKKVKFFCVGPLIPDDHFTTVKLQKQEKVRKWLDAKEALAVIYVSFGTIAVPKPEYIKELVEALRALGKPFIWSLPRREQSRLPEDFLSKKQTQFEVSDSQFLILDWAPQRLILQHPATAVFLSHCGWNSTIESLACGVPVVAWPMFADQKLNALELVKKGSGLLIEGTGMVSKRLIPAEEIKEAVLGAAGFDQQDRGSTCRGAAQKWRDTFKAATAPDGTSQRDFLELIKFEN